MKYGFSWNRPPKDVVIDLIQHFNPGLHLESIHTRLGRPFVMDVRTDIDTDQNTGVKVVIDQQIDARFRTGGDMLYRRSLFSEQGITTLKDTFDIPFTLSSVLPLINKQYGVQIQKSDIIDYTIIKTVPYLLMQAHPDSLLWRGTTKVVLDDNILQVTDLSGFVPEYGTVA